MNPRKRLVDHDVLQNIRNSMHDSTASPKPATAHETRFWLTHACNSHRIARPGQMAYRLLAGSFGRTDIPVMPADETKRDRVHFTGTCSLIGRSESPLEAEQVDASAVLVLLLPFSQPHCGHSTPPGGRP